jgi:hypothetical protein
MLPCAVREQLLQVSAHSMTDEMRRGQELAAAEHERTVYNSQQSHSDARSTKTDTSTTQKVQGVLL